MQRKGRKYKDRIIERRKVFSSFLLSYHTNISNKLHSIPKLKKNVKSNVLYSIPCATVLALLSGLFFNIIFGNNTCYAESTVSLSVDGSTSKTIQEAIVPNETKYVSSSVTYTATDVNDYAINISYANNSAGLKLDGGDTVIPNVVDNTTGSSISNAWGYSWTSQNTSSSTYVNLAYNTIPAYTNARTIESGTSTNTTTKQLIFAANLSDSNPTGHYKTNVLLSLVATPKATIYTLTFNANGGTGGTTTKTCTTYGTSCTISLSDVTAPTRTNYTFLGWADSNNAASAQYTASSTITMNGNKTIYAVWKDTRTLPNITYMQDMNSDICSNTSIGASKTLTDSRDNKSYTIQKYPDGKCWMTSNLQLQGSRTLTSADSNVNSNWTLPAPLSSPSSSSFSSSNYYAAESYSTGSSSAGTTMYYSYTVATAGWATSSVTSGTAPQSICPKGWRLPTGGYSDNSDFYNLFKNMGLTISGSLATSGGTSWSSGDLAIAQGSTYNFKYTGYIYYGSLNGGTSSGYWWSGTVLSASSAYFLHVYSSGVSPGTNNNLRYLGFAVRCVSQ